MNSTEERMKSETERKEMCFSIMTYLPVNFFPIRAAQCVHKTQILNVIAVFVEILPTVKPNWDASNSENTNISF